jgi:hypothetical protein
MQSLRPRRDDSCFLSQELFVSPTRTRQPTKKSGSVCKKGSVSHLRPRPSSFSTARAVRLKRFQNSSGLLLPRPAGFRLHK